MGKSITEVVRKWGGYKEVAKHTPLSKASLMNWHYGRGCKMKGLAELLDFWMENKIGGSNQ